MKSKLDDILSSDLRDWPSELGYSAIDFVRAFSLAPKIGTLTWRVLYQLEEQWKEPLIRALSEEANVRRELAELAIHEALSPECRRCRGAKNLKIGDKVQDCSTCAGTGLHRFSDSYRARYLKWSVKYTRHQSSSFKRVRDLLSEYDRAVLKTLKKQLPKD